MRACRNRFSPIHRRSSTSVRCMTAIWPAGPPNVCSEIRNQVRIAVPRGTTSRDGGHDDQYLNLETRLCRCRPGQRRCTRTVVTSCPGQDDVGPRRSAPRTLRTPALRSPITTRSRPSSRRPVTRWSPIRTVARPPGVFTPGAVTLSRTIARPGRPSGPHRQRGPGRDRPVGGHQHGPVAVALVAQVDPDRDPLADVAQAGHVRRAGGAGDRPARCAARCRSCVGAARDEPCRARPPGVHPSLGLPLQP